MSLTQFEIVQCPCFIFCNL
uniref:Uncharacterized protein n=1 Tax=Anguilla anguilla TaxID=7936 RepID=A0A0E9T4D1_ANGAN